MKMAELSVDRERNRKKSTNDYAVKRWTSFCLSSRQESAIFWTDDATAVYYQVSADKSKERVDDSEKKIRYVKRKVAENDFPKIK